MNSKFSFLITVSSILVFSCLSGQAQKSQNTVSNINYKELNGFGYIDPFYEFESTDAENSALGQNYIRYNSFILDSLFSARPRKYKIEKKLVINKYQRSYLKVEINKVLNEIESGKSLENLIIPEELISNQESSLEYLLLFLINTTIISAEEKYAPAVVLAPDNPYFYIDSSDVSVLIFSLTEQKFVFYERRTAKHNDLGYQKKMIEDLRYFYKRLKKK
jgi:hypothetical protein